MLQRKLLYFLLILSLLTLYGCVGVIGDLPPVQGYPGQVYDEDGYYVERTNVYIAPYDDWRVEYHVYDGVRHTIYRKVIIRDGRTYYVYRGPQRVIRHYYPRTTVIHQLPTAIRQGHSPGQPAPGFKGRHPGDRQGQMRQGLPAQGFKDRHPGDSQGQMRQAPPPKFQAPPPAIKPAPKVAPSGGGHKHQQKAPLPQKQGRK